jgi:hypothetical protein
MFLNIHTDETLRIMLFLAIKPSSIARYIKITLDMLINEQKLTTNTHLLSSNAQNSWELKDDIQEPIFIFAK